MNRIEINGMSKLSKDWLFLILINKKSIYLLTIPFFLLLNICNHSKNQSVDYYPFFFTQIRFNFTIFSLLPVFAFSLK
jgi:hypothetical protein